MKSYVVYVSVRNLGRKEAKQQLKKVTKQMLKQARGKERWFFLTTQADRTEVMRLG